MTKMYNSLISIVVPVYNVETYLRECVDSLLEQDYTNIEIILVDDGAKDSSGQICDDYAEKYTFIKTVHKQNGGLSDTRNVGISVATGEYIVFVDSDDLIAHDMVSRLYESICETDSDVAVCGLAHFLDGETPNYVYGENKKVFVAEKAVGNFLYQQDISPSSCGKMYKIDLFRDIQYPVGMVFEDNKVTFEILSIAKKIVYIDSLLYAYRHRRNSITTSNFSQKDFDIIKIGKYILHEVQGGSDEVKMAAICYQVTNALRIYLGATDEYLNCDEYIYCEKFLKENVDTVYKDKNIRKKLKLALILFRTRMPRKLMIFIHSKVNQWK